MKKLSLFVMSTFFFSCGSGDNIPDSILQIDKMVQVQVGIHMLEAEQGERTIDQALTGVDTFSFHTVSVMSKLNNSHLE